MANYNFHYLPLEGKISGLDFQRQTEDAINDLGNSIQTIEVDISDIEEAVKLSQNAVNIANNAESIAEDALDTAGYAVTSAAAYASDALESANTAQAVATTLTDIYNEAIEQGTITAPAVDPTLTISGAAADAKVTGEIKQSLVDSGILNLYTATYTDAYTDKTLNTSGWASVLTDYNVTSPISVDGKLSVFVDYSIYSTYFFCRLVNFVKIRNYRFLVRNGDVYRIEISFFKKRSYLVTRKLQKLILIRSYLGVYFAREAVREVLTYQTVFHIFPYFTYFARKSVP